MFGYKILDENVPTKYPSRPPNLPRTKEILLNHLGSRSYIPKNMDIQTWGPVVNISDIEYISIKEIFFASYKEKW